MYKELSLYLIQRGKKIGKNGIRFEINKLEIFFANYFYIFFTFFENTEKILRRKMILKRNS